jgi:hypothetical protein
MVLLYLAAGIALSPLASPETGNRARSYSAQPAKIDRLTRRLTNKLKECRLHATLVRENPRNTIWIPHNLKATAIFWLRFPDSGEALALSSGRFECFSDYARSQNVEIIPPVVPVS